MATEEKLKEDELKQIIRKKRGGNWIEYHGPYKIGTANVYQIWTWINENKEDKDDWTPQTRFWLEEENGAKLYFNYFSELALELHKLFESAARQGADIDLAMKKETEALKLKRITLYVAAFAFLAAVLAVIAVILLDKGSTALIIAALTGLVSSGATYFFGVWQPVTPRRSGSRSSQTPS
jgi:hypothetical protein